MRLSDGTAIGYLIDAQNRRIGKTVNDTLVRAWLYQGQLTPVAELDGQGNVVSRFVYATGVNVPDYLVRNDSTYRLVRDHLGSVRLVVNVASGTVAQRLSYDEFIETENTNPAWQPFGYAGGLTDAQTGLVRFGARDYDPASGRWTAKDPIGFAGGDAALYTYVGSDPISSIDPTGEARIGIRPFLDRPRYFIGPRKPRLGAYHVHLFFDDGQPESDIGFFDEIGLGPDNRGGWSRSDYLFDGLPASLGGGRTFDDVLMRQALASIRARWEADSYNLLFNNCQDFIAELVRTYDLLEAMRVPLRFPSDALPRFPRQP